MLRLAPPTVADLPRRHRGIPDRQVRHDDLEHVPGRMDRPGEYEAAPQAD